eukprot:TRINITY_DN77099_c0_g1_i1.p1 TRINITY_DN77099_c0_g1~~TRINITY_DN77099_c0_g1_i1.p1  ORF type:complete len:482 (+),score=89.50 TRINITY_DN77099_c0_g1_i1:106-1446(+)
MELLDSNNGLDRIYVEPFGIPHKRLDNCMFPAFVDTAAIASLKNTWKAKNATYFVVPRMLGFPSSQGLELCIALAENWEPELVSTSLQPEFWKNFPGRIAHTGSQMLNAFQKGTPTPMPPEDFQAYMGRCLEWIAQLKARGVRDRSLEGGKCFITKLPPSLMPAVEACSCDVQRMASSSDLDRDVRSESPRREQIAVFCADPRYLMMCDFKLLTGVLEQFSKASPDFDGFLEFLSQSACSPLKAMIEWAKLEASRPSQVKLFFIEDFLREPEMTLSSLYDFLGLRKDSESLLLETVTQEMQVCLHSCQMLFGDGDHGVPELQVMHNMVQEFEAQLALRPGAALAWAEQSSEFLQLCNMGSPFPSKMLPPSLPWWWEAHEAGTCRPCTFARKGMCRNSAVCGFCHGVHEAPKARPSKKTRMRRDRRRQELREELLRCRTPSPAGLSS